MGDIYTNPPQSRNEAIIRATIDGTEYTDPPQSRIEDLLLELKEKAAIAEIIPAGQNLIDLEKCKYNWKPTANGTATYDDGSTVPGTNTTNLWTVSNGEKIKFSGDMGTYFRAFIYGSNGKYRNAIQSYNTDTDGNYYITVNDAGAASMCFVITGTLSTLTVTRYDEWGPKKVIIENLYFDDDNVEMAREHLGIPKNVLYNKKWAVAGDSFTAGDFTGVTTPTIPNGRYAGKKAVYPYLIGNRCNMTIQDLSNGGRTIAYPADETSENSFALLYQNVAEDADYLTIYLGINDSHQATAETGQIPIGTITDNTINTFYGAWNVILSWLVANRPNLKIGIIVSNGCDSDDYRTATIAIANKYGIPYIDMNGDEKTPCMIRSTNANIDTSIRNQRTANWRVSGTNAHPNAAAHAYEATFIENFLKTL